MPRVSGQDAPEVEDEEPGGRARHLLTTTGAVLLGLWGLAIAQPILDLFGSSGYRFYALLYPLAIGSLAALAGFLTFRRSDLP